MIVLKILLTLQAQICLLVTMNANFLIPLNGLVTGETQFFWLADKKFFEDFDNSEILDAKLEIDVIVEKSGTYIGVDCMVDGELTVECDRCLEPLTMPIEVDILLSVKYGLDEFIEEAKDSEDTDDREDEEREVIYLEQDEAELDMSQIIYDYVYLSLPIQRIHPEGECNPEVVKHIIGFTEDNVSEAIEEEQEEHPFASLKDLFKN